MMAEYNVVTLFEIREEFATCDICQEDFDMAARSPRVLPCSHSFCCDCLECIWGKSTSGVQCPKCRRVWPVQSNIKTTFHQNNVLMNLVEYLALKNKPGNIPCWQCPKSRKATVHCLDCQKYLCDFCSNFHSRFLDNHKSVPLSEFIKSPQTFFQQKDVCRDHDRMKMDLFCKNATCKTAACISCAYVSHKDHEICNLKDMYEQRKKAVSSSLDGLLKSTVRSNKYRDGLTEQKNELQTIQQHLLQFIEDSKTEIIKKVEEKAKQLEEDVVANIAQQQADRDKQMDIVTESENAKAEHALHCQQALAFTRAAEFIAMSEDLETKANSLTEIPDLFDMQIQDVNLDLETFEKINRILEKTASVYDGSDMRSCIEVTDAKVGEDSNIINVTLLPKADTQQRKPVLLEAVVVDPKGKESKVEQNTASISSDGGSLVFRPECVGLHKAYIRINGRRLTEETVDFHSNEHGADVARKILISIDAEPGLFREIILPAMQFDRDRLNWERRTITEDGYLTNEPSPQPEFERDARLRHLCGVTSRTPVTGPGCSYWQVQVNKKVLEAADVGYVSAQTGICLQDHCDEYEFEENHNAWCVEVRTCKEHNGVCLHVFSRGALLCDSALTDFKPEAVIDVDLGFLMDFDKGVLHVMHLQRHEIVHSIPDVDSDQPLMPVFAVYSPSLFDVQLRLVSGVDLPVDRDFLVMLSRIVQGGRDVTPLA
ncbi:uncharacterized protein LOC121373947 [Gigantopelta aegis]|uniref:uncharacterized protein LOC121373947 n=1 Tax=Gigantopelta aegis TaxID=1735272 RepID=UPI001B88C758|nr:uncharacterized protein LOC121373947 [Gigantopelta aegis]